MKLEHRRSGGRIGNLDGALALPLLVALAACDPEPVYQPASLLSTPLPIEHDTSTFVPMDGNPPPTSTPEPAEEVSVAADPEPEEEMEEDSSPYAYPAWNGYDLDCADVGHTVKVTGADPHRLDRDGDGWGCESY
ncbi:MAG TPA: hypothetical protein VGB92_15655 [Longimicrobium sp.]|jgi:hypothetical protein